MEHSTLKPVVVNSKKTLEVCITALSEAWERGKYLRVSWKTGRDRSMDQQALAECWYRQISHELGEGTPEDVKCECKLRFGVAILRAGDEEFRAIWDEKFKGRIDYEQKLALMRYLPVTSLMSTEQMTAYLDTVQKEMARRGVLLESRDGV